MARIGVLVINVGTPDEPSTPAVRRYLRQFLSDPRVIDSSPVARWLLLNFIILPFRSRKSAAAYRTIWTERGSPLLYHSKDFVSKLTDLIDDPDIAIELAMRYQSPSIDSALNKLIDRGVEELVVFPMFPQYSSAAYGTAVQEVMEQVGRQWNVLPVSVVPPFYDREELTHAFAQVGKRFLQDKNPDYYLFSFHGLPERHCQKSQRGNVPICCHKPDCCHVMTEANRFCYRAQCFVSARAIAESLSLPEGSWEVTFQSRLGRDPWIKPYTDIRINELAREGYQRLAVFCPAFVADCLETSEEIGIRAHEDFVAAGGQQVWLVPGLNAEEEWVKAAFSILSDYLPRQPG